MLGHHVGLKLVTGKQSFECQCGPPLRLCPLPGVVFPVHKQFGDQLKSAICGIECAGEIISG